MKNITMLSASAHKSLLIILVAGFAAGNARSEERRVGKEC